MVCILFNHKKMFENNKDIANVKNKALYPCGDISLVVLLYYQNIINKHA